MQALKTEAGFGSHAFGESDDEGVDEGRGGCHGMILVWFSPADKKVDVRLLVCGT